MAEENNQPTPEQLEAQRDVGKRNLNAEALKNLSLAYRVHKSGVYGKAGDEAVQNFKYLPSFQGGATFYDQNGEEVDLVQSAILGSRVDGEMYSGNVSEGRILKTANKIMYESIGTLKVEDLLENVEADTSKLKEEFKGKYIADLTEDQQKEIIGTFTAYQNDKGVSEALGDNSEIAKTALESLVMTPEQPELSIAPRQSALAA